MVVDDYGHHPTEIAATIAAARLFGRRLVVAFQPHRFTRTQDLMQDFAPALAGADEIVLTDIYPAGEPPIPGVDIQAVLRTFPSGAKVSYGPRKELAAHLADICAREGVPFVARGAGTGLSGGALPVADGTVIDTYYPTATFTNPIGGSIYARASAFNNRANAAQSPPLHPA